MKRNDFGRTVARTDNKKINANFKKGGGIGYQTFVLLMKCVQDKKNATEESGKKLYLFVAFFLTNSIASYPPFLKLRLSLMRYASCLGDLRTSNFCARNEQTKTKFVIMNRQRFDMRFWNSIGLLFLLCVCSYSDNKAKPPSENYFGTSISNSMRRGHTYTDSTGMKYFYCYINVSITNDSLIPVNVKVAFTNEYYQPTPTNGQKFKVFLLPEFMTPEKKTDFNVLNKFLDEGLENSISIDKVIKPKEEYSLNIGFLTELKSPLNPSPFVLFSKGHKQHFESIPDSVISKVPSAENQLTLLLGLDFFPLGQDSIKRYSIIPCGQISYSN